MFEDDETEVITIILVEPGKEARLAEMTYDLKSMQQIVGGWIEELDGFGDPVVLVCNEVGKLDGLPLNRAIFYPDSDEIADVICGTFFLGYLPEGADGFESFPKDLADKYLERFRYPERFYRVNGQIEREIVTQKLSRQRSARDER